MILENNLTLRVFLVTGAYLEVAHPCGCMNTIYSTLYSVYDLCFHPTVRTYARMYDLLAHAANRPFSSSIFSLRVCRKNLQKITKLLLELWRFSATARGVIRPAVAFAGSSDEPGQDRVLSRFNFRVTRSILFASFHLNPTIVC